MDYWKMLEELHVERQRLSRAIAVLEGMRTDSPVVARRGRRSMPAEERRIVAERMRAYWARRRNGDAAQAVAPDSGVVGGTAAGREAYQT